jgi:hypothetical protein
LYSKYFILLYYFGQFCRLEHLSLYYFVHILVKCFLIALFHLQIRMLDLVLKMLPEDSKEPQTARILLYKLFYDQTEEGMTQFLLNLIKTFDTHKQCKRFHLFIWTKKNFTLFNHERSILFFYEDYGRSILKS